jgi:hypothetical protein
VELVVACGEVQLLSGVVLTNFPEGILPDSNSPFCGTNTAFDLVGRPTTGKQVDYVITLDVEVTGTRQGYGGGGDCAPLDWELSKVVTATITPSDGAVLISLKSPNGDYTLDALLPAG